MRLIYSKYINLLLTIISFSPIPSHIIIYFLPFIPISTKRPHFLACFKKIKTNIVIWRHMKSIYRSRLNHFCFVLIIIDYIKKILNNIAIWHYKQYASILNDRLLVMNRSLAKIYLLNHIDEFVFLKLIATPYQIIHQVLLLSDLLGLTNVFSPQTYHL